MDDNIPWQNSPYQGKSYYNTQTTNTTNIVSLHTVHKISIYLLTYLLTEVLSCFLAVAKVEYEYFVALAKYWYDESSLKFIISVRKVCY